MGNGAFVGRARVGLVILGMTTLGAVSLLALGAAQRAAAAPAVPFASVPDQAPARVPAEVPDERPNPPGPSSGSKETPGGKAGQNRTTQGDSAPTGGPPPNARTGRHNRPVTPPNARKPAGSRPAGSTTGSPGPKASPKASPKAGAKASPKAGQATPSGARTPSARPGSRARQPVPPSAPASATNDTKADPADEPGATIQAAPLPPTLVVVTGGTNQISLTWVGSLSLFVDGYTATATMGATVKTCTTSGLGCTITNLAAGTWTVAVVTNRSGEVSPQAGPFTTSVVDPFNPPGTPTNVTATAGASSITVNWAAPTNVGAGIDHYTVTAALSGQNCVTVTTSCTITGLTPGTFYTFSVVASAPGTSGSSLPSGLTPAVAPGPPGSPIGAGAVALSTSAQVSWLGPLNAGGGIANYVVTSTPGNKTCTTTGLTCTVSGLTSGVSYTFNVVTVGPGATGSSAPATTSAVVPGPPSPPKNVKVTVGALGLINVTWDAPDNPGGGIAGYVATANPGLLLNSCATLLATDRSCTILGLLVGQSYTVSVVANGVGLTGPSQASDPSAPVIAGPPGTPTNVTATAGANGATVSWTPPSSAGAGITGYVVSASPGIGACATSGSSCTVNGLAAGTPYTFTVVATSLVGNSDASTPTAAVTPGPPGMPTGVSATAGQNAATVNWTAPSNAGGGIAGYTVTSLPGGRTCTTNGATTCTVTGLTAGVAYTFSVVATGVTGTGNSLASLLSLPVVPGPPGTPSLVTAIARDRSAVVAWLPPLSLGAGIDHYLVTSSPDNKACTSTLLTCTVTGLTPGTGYTFTVTAVGTGTTGSSAASTPSSAVTPGPPGSPTDVQVTGGNGFLDVTWDAPVLGGSLISGYIATASPGAHVCVVLLSSQKTCRISGVDNGTQYQVAVVSVGVGDVGDSAPSTPSDPVIPLAPTAPINAVATPTVSSATVAWQTPTVLPLGTTLYRVTASPGGATCTSLVVLNTCTVTGLTSGTSYTFSVVAVGLLGAESPAATTDPVIPGPPGAPTGVTATPGPNRVTVSWTAPGNPGGGIARYDVTASPGGGTCSAPAGATSCAVTGLDSLFSYTFSVVAVGSGATGSSSAGVTSVGVTPGPPGAPLLVTATGGPNSATVSWTPPLVTAAGIASYTVTASPGGRTCSTATTSCVVTGLASGQAYTFTVVAVGVGGTGSSTASLPSLGVQPGPPGAPTGVTVTAGNTQLSVSWTAPVNNGGGIASYLATANPGSKTCTTSVLTTCVITGLTNGQAYTVSVVAVGTGATGPSAAGTASASATPGPPGAPTDVTAAPGIASATVSWTAPVSSGAGVTGYTVSSSPASLGCVALLATSCVVSGLTPGTSYTFTVVANGLSGDSAASVPSPAITPGPPGAATAVTAVATTTPGEATVSWTAPVNTGSGVANYTVTSLPGGHGCTVNALTCTVTGLTDGLPYTFLVTTNGAPGTGQSLPSAPSGSVVTGPPGEPTLVTASAGNGEATISWVAPLNKGAGVTGYKVTASPDGATCTTTTATACVIDNLTNSQAYTFTVVALGRAGNSSDSLASFPVTPTAGVPGSPGSVTATADADSVTVNWLASTGSVDDYTVTLTPGGATCTVAALTCDISVAPGIYAVSVVATGSGGSSSPAVAVVGVGSPGIATGVQATVAGDKVTLSWLAPAFVGAGIAGYTVTLDPGGLSCTTNGALTCDISAVPPGAYTASIEVNGPGGVSVPVTANVTTGVPGVPTGITVTPGAGQITVSWGAPGLVGAGLSGYKVVLSPSDGGCQVGTGVTSCVITGLTDGTPYTVTVLATGPGGDSLPGAGGLISTGAPAAPTAVQVTAGTNQADVSWTGAAGIIDSYLVTSSGGPTCVAIGATTCTVTGLTGGVPYTFVVVSVGPGGVSLPSLPSLPVAVGPPGSPTGVGAVAGPNQITVSWTAPDDQGAGIDHFLVTSTPGNEVCQANAAATSCVVTNLSNLTGYTFSVVAVGEDGTGRSAPAVTIVPVTPGPPGAPTGVVATPGAGAATVQWIAPVATGAGIASYTVTASPGGRTCTASSGTSCVVTGLVSGTAYSFNVVAVGTDGSGSSSAGVTAVSVTPGPPGAPTGVTVTPGLGSAQVRWSVPSAVGAGVASYTVTASPGGAQCTTTLLTCTVAGLNPLSPHTFTVVANGVGDTGTSVAGNVPAAVVPGPAGAPTTVTAVPGDKSAVVSWAQPLALGAGITGYTATASTGQNCTSALLTCTVTGLSAGVPVTFTVVATGAGGDSQPSDASGAVSPGPPGLPTAVTATPGAGSASVHWTAPTSAGAGISSYRATAAPGGAFCVTTGDTCVVAGLIDGTVYTFTVKAVGAGLSGESPASLPSDAVTTGVPGLPTITGVVAGSGQATVSWTRPGAVGAGLTGYEVTANPGGISCATAGTSCTLTGLTDGVAYTFSVVATGPAGNSLPAATLTPTVTGPPGVPVSVTANAGNGQATVTWTAPGNLGAGISGYTVTSTPPGLGCTTTGATTCLITGLSNGTAYTFSVVADGLVGASGVSSASVAVTPTALVPDAPGNVSVTPGTGQVTVSWAAAPDATGYTVTAGSQTCTTTTATSCTISGLTDGTPFNVSVVASGVDGPSAPAVVPAVVTGPPSVPRSVTLVTGNGTAVVSWQAPLNAGAGVSAYKVTLNPGGLTCQVTVLTCTITGLTNGQSYTASVVALGVVGTSSANISAAAVTGAPGAPTGVTVTPSANGAVVSWTTPGAAGAGITSYTATAAPGGATCTTPALTCQLGGLAAGQLYTVTVTATGPGGTSAASVPPTQLLTGPPSEPRSVTATPGNARAQVSWSLPTQPGGGVDHYVVTSSGGQSCSSALLSCAVNGLSNGVAYTFTVRAVGVGQTGISAPSTPTGSVTPSASLAGAPTGVAATAGNAAISVTWTPPTAAGDGIDHYTATAYPDGARCRTTTATSCTITGLVNGRTYRVVVAAVTTGSAGSAALSDYVTGLVPRATKPVAPTAASAVAGDSAATVSWSASPGATAYTVTASPGGATCTTTGLTCTVSGLANGTRYAFAVRATVGGALTLPSPWSNPVTPAVGASSVAAPAAPTDVQVASGNGELTVSWTQPVGGAPVVDTTVTVDPGGQSCVIVGTSCTVTGLTNGTAYDVTVVARGALAESPPASASRPAVPSIAPGPVTNVTVTPRYSSLVVSWTPPSDPGTGIAYYSAETSTGNGWCVAVGAAASECVMYVPIDEDYTVTVNAHGLHDRLSPDASGSTIGRPDWPAIPDDGPSGPPSLTASKVTVAAGGETLTINGSDFAPNSSVQIVLFRSASATGASIAAAMEVLATVTVGEDGTFSVPTDVPDISSGATLAAYGVAPDGSIRTLHVTLTRAAAQVPVQDLSGGSGSPGGSSGSSGKTRHASLRTGSGGSDDGTSTDGSLARTGTPIFGIVALGLILLLLGVFSSLLAGARRMRRRPSDTLGDVADELLDELLDEGFDADRPEAVPALVGAPPPVSSPNSGAHGPRRDRPDAGADRRNAQMGRYQKRSDDRGQPRRRTCGQLNRRRR